MRESLIPYSVGQEVIEVIGSGPNKTSKRVKITHMSDSCCKTETGNWYLRDTGSQVHPEDATQYKAIHSPSYIGAGQEFKPR